MTALEVSTSRFSDSGPTQTQHSFAQHLVSGSVSVLCDVHHGAENAGCCKTHGVWLTSLHQHSFIHQTHVFP